MRSTSGAAPAPHDASRDDGAWGRSRRALTVGLVLTVAFSAFEALAIATVLPVTARDIGGLALYGWTFSGFMLASLVGTVAAGRAADVRGLAMPFAVGVALFVAGLLGAGVAPTMPVLVAARIVQGSGAGAINAVSYAAIAVGYPDPAKPRMLALLSSAWVVPGLIGPALAGAIADHLGWRLVFLGLAPPTVLAGALALPALRRLPRAGGAAAGRTGAALALAAGFGCVLLGLQRGEPWLRLPGSEPWLRLLAVGGGLVLAAPALLKLFPAGTLRAAPGQPAAVAVMALLGFAFFGVEAFVPLAISDVRGRSATVAGLPLTLGTLAWTAGAWIQAREAARRSRRALIGAGVATILAGVAATASALVPSVPLAAVACAWAVAALGMGIAYSTTALAILETAPAGGAGASSAALQLAMTLGTALGTGAAGALLAAVTARGGSTADGIAAVDAAGIAALALCLLVARRLPGRPATRSHDARR